MYVIFTKSAKTIALERCPSQLPALGNGLHGPSVNTPLKTGPGPPKTESPRAYALRRHSKVFSDHKS